ncbi:hypothetical protein BC659_0639 [Sediminibacterium goheungense]|uniref:YhhN-like protein n=1 Tax=Sediminibacterium goheungense TaxID=1086393 RepID=A0A4R6J052_9BACT|nr:hypothetical protein BC659_0639 [Sediminibacterium goheungense]
MNDIRIDWIILLVAVITGFSIKTRPSFPYLRTIPLLLLLSLSVELVARYYRVRSINNLWLVNLYSVIELCYFAYTLYLILRKTFVLRLMVLIACCCLIDIFLVHGLKTFHTYSYTFSVLIIVYVCIYYYYHTFKEAQVDNLLKEPSFWIVTGLLVFYATSLSVAGVFNFIATLPKEMIRLTRSIILFVNGVFYIILIIAFVCQINTRKSIPNS